MTSLIPSPEPQYSVTTWDGEKNAYTPQNGVPSLVTGFSELRKAIRALRLIGYSAHSNAYDSDDAVLIERVSPPSPLSHD